MSFEILAYQHKRLRSQGSREWKLWFTQNGNQLDFRILAKDPSIDCYEDFAATAIEIEGDLIVCEDDNEEAYMTDGFRYEDENGSILIYLEAGDRELAWVKASGEYADNSCNFEIAGPLMPEFAG